MAGNSIGKIFCVTTFGESHGTSIGAVIDGCPAGLEIDENFIQHQLDRRKPGQSVITTQRNESDTVKPDSFNSNCAIPPAATEAAVILAEDLPPPL